MTSVTRKILGVLTPSSNTILEPLTSEILLQAPNISAHFGRFRVTQITLDEKGLGQFSLEAPLAAASLLADAKPGVIAWSGTSASWLGFDQDHRLCAEIKRRSGITACTSVLALNELLALNGHKTLGLVSPYTTDVQAKIIQNYSSIGVKCISEAHCSIQDNYSFSEIDESTIEKMIRKVAQSCPEAITVMCTNMKGARLASRLEAELGIPIYDSVSTVVWKSIRLLEEDPSRIQGWGNLYAC